MDEEPFTNERRGWPVWRRIGAGRVLATAIGVGAGLSFGLAPGVVCGQSGGPQGPPQFLTVPTRSRMLPTGLVNGHVVYVPPVAADHMGGPEFKPGGGQNGHNGGNNSGGTADFGQPGGVNVTSDCFADSPSNFDATCAQDSYQGEPMAVGAGSLLIGAENDIYPGACSASAAPGSFGDCGLSTTRSSTGESWTRTKLSRSWGGHDFLLGFDPSVAIDSAGRAFSCFGVADGGASGPNGVAVVSSADGGSTWLKANPVVLDLSGKYFEDKFWIAADASAASPYRDRLYVAWDRNSGNNQLLVVASSSDHGKTWTSPVKINDGRSKFERVIDAFPAVAPDGTVYVLWDDYARNELFADRSSDGGATWGQDVAVAPTHIGFGTDIGCNGTRSMGPSPQMAVAADGTVYVVYADAASSSGDYDVYLTRSTNGGRSWSTPKRVSSTSTGHQYNPALTIDGNGAVRVTYLDRRNDPGDCRTNTYMSSSSDGGVTFVDARITDVDSSFDGNPNGPGDYGSVTALGSVVYPYFADHRDANATVDGATATLDGGFEIYAAHTP